MAADSITYRHTESKVDFDLSEPSVEAAAEKTTCCIAASVQQCLAKGHGATPFLGAKSTNTHLKIELW